MKSLILICGNAGAGKTTITKMITEKYNKYVNIALGDKVKELTFKLLKIFNIPITSIDDLYDTEKKKQYRYYLQNIATEAIRETFGKDIWCNLIYETVKNNDFVIISDIRFMNEVEYFTEKFKKSVHVIKVVKNDIEIMNHQSETEINTLPYDTLIENNGTLEQLQSKVINIVDSIEYYYLPSSSGDDFEEEFKENSTNDNETTNEEKKTNDNREKTTNNNEEEITEEKTAENIISERSLNINEELKKDSITIDNKEHNKGFSSYALGKIGEDDIVKMIQQVRPNYETTDVAKTGHLGDIHTIDYDRNIKYIFEIKLKQSITKNDIDKFEKDYKEMNDSNTQFKYIIGVFVSLNSSSIPSKGALSITKNKIYLTQKYISVQVFDIVFKMIETYLNTLENIAENKQNINYIIPPNVYSLIASLRTQYKDINKEYDMITSMRNHNEEDRKYIDNLLINIDTKKEFIKFLSTEFNEILPSIEVDLSNKEEERLIKYIQNHDMKKIQKKDIIKEFPTFATEIGNLGKNGFINKYSKKAQKQTEEETTTETQTETEQELTSLKPSFESSASYNESDYEHTETETETKTKTKKASKEKETKQETKQETKPRKYKPVYEKDTKANRRILKEFVLERKDNSHFRKRDIADKFPFVKDELEKTTLKKFITSLTE